MRNLKNSWKMSLLCLSQVHRPSRYGKRRWHHQSHHHKRCNHQGLYLRDRMMHPKNEWLFSSQVLSGGLKNPNPCCEVTSVVIHIYFLALHKLFFTLAYLLFCISIAFRKKGIPSAESSRSVRGQENKKFCIINSKPHVNKSTVCKQLREYSPRWHQNKNTMHTYFLSCIWKKIRKTSC